MNQILYRNPLSKDGRTMVVGTHERVRRRILEHAGWRADPNAEIAEPVAGEPENLAPTLVYRCPGTDKALVVGSHERVRRRILEQDGWTSSAVTVIEHALSTEPQAIEGPTAYDFTDIEGVDADVSDFLNEAGFHALEDLRAASDAALLKIPGIGKATLSGIRKALKRDIGALN